MAAKKSSVGCRVIIRMAGGSYQDVNPSENIWTGTIDGGIGSLGPSCPVIIEENGLRRCLRVTVTGIEIVNGEASTIIYVK